ncbi:ATP-binding protein [Ovoidimarina sediminis]|uniref:ATP-binding protein n=1 Tax=Ovoidimarina sediminis TaxID=3079856 RepID=UPI002907237E|nr:ATP-binding protein [Rhodophyticola sp. MJ-SS7]MDU8942452.1 ATP-binding protein [Rhodophyticola sp. MJ-SS7]
MLETDRITETLRSRLATESLLTQRQKELLAANTRIAEQARALSDEVIGHRDAAARARREAETLKGRNRTALMDLRRATSQVQMAERRLWAALETIEDGFAVFDQTGAIIAANHAFFRPFSDMEGIGLGTTYGELVDIAAEEGLIDPSPHSRRDWAAWMKARWEARVIEPVTLRFFNDSFVKLSERRTDDGDLVMLAVNMTGTMRREKALEAARHSAEAANRAKSSFLANMSHEIRTPMNGVLAMADLMAEGTLDEDQRLCLDTIRSSGEALLVIINDVLDYSKIEAKKLTLVEEPFDLERTVSEVITLLQPAAREKGLSLVADYDMFLPTSFIGDKGRVRQVLLNLVGNAVKFTERGHVLVRIVGLPEAEGGQMRLHLTVEDTGIGIEPGQKELIFGEFNQADGASTRRYDGTGLGLSITHRLVRLMGGEIWLDSTPGEGSVFGIWLKLPVDNQKSPSPADLSTEGRQVLLMDSDVVSRSILAKQLMALGFSAPHTLPSGHPVRLAAIGPRDVLVRAEESGPAGRIRVSVGPGEDGPSADLQKPVLRDDLVAALGTLLAEPAAPAPPEPVVEAEAPRRAMRVLAAEDNRTNRIVLEKLLKTLDIDLEIVEDGQIALERFTADPPDLVFTDISMPRMDGLEAARRIRAAEEAAGLPRTPIVAMTAHALEETARDIAAAGINHCLTKPLKKTALVEHIQMACPDGARAPLPEPEPA